MLAAENGVRRAGRGDDDVRAVTRVIQVVKLDGLTVELLRQSDGAVVRAVGDEDRSTAVGHQMACGQFAHLASADDKNVLALQGSENLLSQFHRN